MDHPVTLTGAASPWCMGTWCRGQASQKESRQPLLFWNSWSCMKNTCSMMLFLFLPHSFFFFFSSSEHDIGRLHVGTSLLLLLRHFSRVRLCVTPETAAHQSPPSLGFSRQEHWSGLPFPSPMGHKSSWGLFPEYTSTINNWPLLEGK